MNKKFIKLGGILIILIVSVVAVLVTLDFDEEDYIFDEHIDNIIEKSGIDPENLVHRSELDGIYSQTYSDPDSGKNVLIVSQLPVSDYRGNPLVSGWTENEGIFTTQENTFIAIANGLETTIIAENDQSNGIKAGDTLVFSPVIKMGGTELLPKSTTATLLKTDPINSNYQNNVLIWDYGICKRYVRIIEGRFLGYWEFEEIPSGDILIEYNQTGDFNLSLGRFKKDDDTEFITVDNFNSLDRLYSNLIISDTATFYPDADPESTSVDGVVVYSSGGAAWATVHDHPGTASPPVCGAASYVSSYSGYTGDQRAGWFSNLWRSIFVFDTSSLPDEATILSSTLSLYGNAKNEIAGNSATYNVFEGSTTTNTNIVALDYPNQGVTELSDSDHTYASWSTTGYNDWDLNTTGISSISKTGVSKFSVREATYDAPDSMPPNNGAAQNDRIGFYFSDQGAGFKPKLVIIYSVAPGTPVVATNSPTNIEETTATGNGNITDAGSGTPTYRGFCWALTDPPTISDSGTLEAWIGATGTYSMSIDGLTEGTHYYERAIAISYSGTSYGSSVDIYTKPNPVTDLTELSVSPTSGTISWSAPSGGLTGYYVRYDTGTYPATYSDGSEWYTGAGTTAGKTGLISGTSYYIRIWTYFTNSPNPGGVSDDYDELILSPMHVPIMHTRTATDINNTSCTGRGQIIDYGGDPVVYRGFCWNLTGTPTTSDYGDYESGTFYDGLYELSVTNFPPNTRIYMRAFATNSLGTGYGDQITFISHEHPIVYTLGVFNVGTSTAIGQGYLADFGGSVVTRSGICWSSSGSPTISDNVCSKDSNIGIGSYFCDITGMNPNDEYYVRAYATNAYSTGYGNEIMIMTVPSYNDNTVHLDLNPWNLIPPSSPGTITDISGYGNDASYILADMSDGITVWTTSLLASGGDFYPSQSDDELPNRWVVPPQSGMTQQGDSSNLPLYEIFEEAATDIGIAPEILYTMMVLSMAMGIGFLVYLIIGNILVALLVMIVMLTGFFSTGVMPFWILIFFVAFSIGIVYVSRQT